MDRRITGLPPTTTAPNWDSRLNLPSSTGDSPEFSQASTDTQWFVANQSFGCFCLLKTDQWHVSPTFPNKIPSLLVGVNKILQAKLSAGSASGPQMTSSFQAGQKSFLLYEESLPWKSPLPMTNPSHDDYLEKSLPTNLALNRDKRTHFMLQRGLCFSFWDVVVTWGYCDTVVGCPATEAWQSKV